MGRFKKMAQVNPTGAWQTPETNNGHDIQTGYYWLTIQFDNGEKTVVNASGHNFYPGKPGYFAVGDTTYSADGSPNTTWNSRVIAWMPQQPPSPYQGGGGGSDQESFTVTEQNFYNLPSGVEEKLYEAATDYYAGTGRFHPDDDAREMMEAFLMEKGGSYEVGM